MKPVVAEVLPYGEVDEKLVYGYFAIPEDMIDPLPAIIVVHDWWGLDDNMREIAQRLAGEGYIVLGVDLFSGGTANALADARDLEISVVENPNLAMENLSQARDFISNTAGAPQVAVLGYGFGGGWSLRATTDLPDGFSASVSYYGQVHDDTDRLGRLNTPFLGLFAEEDRAIPAADVKRFAAALESLEKDVEVILYPDARRGFADPRSENYNAETANEAWRRAVKFLAENMAQSE